jgi:hypothetical protein
MQSRGFTTGFSHSSFLPFLLRDRGILYREPRWISPVIYRGPRLLTVRYNGAGRTSGF